MVWMASKVRVNAKKQKRHKLRRKKRTYVLFLNANENEEF